MQVISDRVSILNKDNVFSLVILPTDKKWKLNLMFIWLMLWTVSGVFYISMYINFSREGDFYHMQYNEAFYKKKTELLPKIEKDIKKTQNARLWMIALLGFWAYFEYKVAKTFFFRKYGREKLWIKNGKMFYQREINKRGKIREFVPSLVNDLEVVNPNRGDFFVQMQESFWVMGGERLSFSYAAKLVKFGIQLSDTEANRVFKELKYELKKH
ncbi:MAG: hypothetical protein K0S33_1431 [Bacteroidetes bacterium]|jgi:hypothetical protein|nr:hypothetical protein [Bacteroidota bacterium]